MKVLVEAAMSTLPGHDHPSSSTASSGCKGDTDSAAKVGKSTTRTGPSYVYYRLYTKLGAFESNRPIYHNDRFIGRIPTKSFAPPHTVASIKLSLCGLEDLSEPDKALLFTPLSSPAPKEDSARLSLYAPSGPGLNEQDPIVLVVESEKRSEEVSQPEKLPERSDDTEIHYGYKTIDTAWLSGEKHEIVYTDGVIVSMGLAADKTLYSGYMAINSKGEKGFVRSNGKGGTDSASKDGKSTKRTGPTYVYYRLYTKLGAFESNHTLYQNDRFIGRIPSKLFAPPHTVASIKRSLCKLEGLLDPDKALVFAPLSSPAPKEDSTRLSLNALSGPGLSELDPIALVVESEKRTKEASQSETQLPECSDNTDIHYVYYRVYLSESEGEAKAKTSFDESDISLGRINTLSIAPPHTAGSLKARIAKVEGLVTPGHALYKDMELFQDTDSDAAMNDTDIISFQGDDYPGSDKRDHVALVNATTNTAADQKAKPTPKFKFYETRSINSWWRLQSKGFRLAINNQR
ncbi:uncharacterized protein LACBIDRAFT_299134 [Laccaria bicolor S238N-H82]|uniref:Predicted protein n=1 Tax=Laccaria bicolor (strain S238N-H82 / ATCC MYA-4686) TaxID=486041 RepID=B0DE53_LACBS|nr:uncharacterized protein LACBIDRAFT_299134 [Laccaria bicolor S238N-H82]EDR07205.1 predicted protein [Laccaria bicolor S238N-H82]|eukprot:XP_001882136.1 predicted protein [Laccaria bicolor S238N-H82]